MFSMNLYIDGKLSGRIDDVKPGSTIGFEVVEPPPKPVVPQAGEPCPCGSGKLHGECHGRAEEAEQVGSSAVEG